MTRILTLLLSTMFLIEMVLSGIY